MEQHKGQDEEFTMSFLKQEEDVPDPGSGMVWDTPAVTGADRSHSSSHTVQALTSPSVGSRCVLADKSAVISSSYSGLCICNTGVHPVHVKSRGRHPSKYFHTYFPKQTPNGKCTAYSVR